MDPSLRWGDWNYVASPAQSCQPRTVILAPHRHASEGWHPSSAKSQLYSLTNTR